MPVVKPDNSGGRLYLVIEQMETGLNIELSIYQVLARYLGVEQSDTMEISFGYIGFVKLLQTVREDISSLSIDDEQKVLFTTPLEHLKNIFSLQTMHLAWKSHHGLIQEIKRDLRFVSVFLSTSGRAETIAKDEDLAELLESIDELLLEVHNSDRSVTFNKLILDRLIDLKRAVKLYPILGINGLVEALELALGTLFIYHNEFDTEDEGKQKIREKFGEILGKASGIILTTSVKQLAETAISKIPLLLSKFP